MLGPTGTVFMEPHELPARFRPPRAPDTPGRWLWRTRDGRETVYWVEWMTYPGARALWATWADGAPEGQPFMPVAVDELAALTYGDGTPMGEWCGKLSELPG